MESAPPPVAASPSLAIPDQPALVAAHGRAVWLSEDGEISDLAAGDVAVRLGDAAPFVCHMPATARRLGISPFLAFDLLELFAFVRPAQFCVPTPKGLAAALGLGAPVSLDDEPLTLVSAAEALLREAADHVSSEREAALARLMESAGWAWGDTLVRALNPIGDGAPGEGAATASPLAVWADLPEWQEQAPEPPADQFGVSAEATRGRLAELLGDGAEARPQQADYASATSQAFAPRDDEETPHIVLAEAGTGVGKTLGYIAPASLWAERNDGAVWISTYTRNLQRQIDQELDRLYPNPAIKAERAVVRKGRENYLCLLNLEEATARAALAAGDRVGLGLMARWVGGTRDGDMMGGDFPAWLVDLLGYGRTRGLADRRGECIYSACTHWRKCYIETSQRKARRADIVIANHALVMTQAAREAVTQAEARVGPSRLVFDEGHHLFDAADSAFSAHLSGRETRELRRWLLGAESRSRGRGKGLKSRIEDLVDGRERAAESLGDVLSAARALPAEGWLERLSSGAPRGPVEAFLALARQQVRARNDDPESAYDLETPIMPAIDGLAEAATVLDQALRALAVPLAALADELNAVLDDESARLETATRQRIEGVLRGIAWRAVAQVAAWRAMANRVACLAEPEDFEDVSQDDGPAGVPQGFVDWFTVDRHDGREIDIAMRRHHLDPAEPFAELVLAASHGALLTSATLRDSSGDEDADWQAAELRTGTRYLAAPAIRAAVPSPFDHAGHTRVLVVTDVRRNDLKAVAAGYRELFAASGGGALGLFTAIRRLRAVHEMIAPPMDALGLPLWAQHVDAMDNSTLVDIFRADENACLLGTDAMRDGVDVPGQSLRLIVFDRVPWPRASYLHKARRVAFGGRGWDEMLTRMRLRQAYGRLVRRADDRGIFVMMDSALPSRLLGAFPEGVPVDRLGLAEAVAAVRSFFDEARN